MWVRTASINQKHVTETKGPVLRLKSLMLQRGTARRLQAAHSLEPLVGSSEGPTAGASELSLLVGSSDDGSESPTERHTLAWPTPISIEKQKKKEELHIAKQLK